MRAIARFRTAQDYKRTPMIRGRIVALNGVPAKDAKVDPGARWALNGDRGITYAASHAARHRTSPKANGGRRITPARR